MSTSSSSSAAHLGQVVWAANRGPNSRSQKANNAASRRPTGHLDRDDAAASGWATPNRINPRSPGDASRPRSQASRSAVVEVVAIPAFPQRSPRLSRFADSPANILDSIRLLAASSRSFRLSRRLDEARFGRLFDVIVALPALILELHVLDQNRIGVGVEVGLGLEF